MSNALSAQLQLTGPRISSHKFKSDTLFLSGTAKKRAKECRELGTGSTGKTVHTRDPSKMGGESLVFFWWR